MTRREKEVRDSVISLLEPLKRSEVPVYVLFGTSPLTTSTKKSGIFERMNRDLRMWLFLRWLKLATVYTKTKNPDIDNDERDTSRDIFRYQIDNVFKDQMTFEVEYMHANFMLTLVAVFPFFFSKIFIRFFEKGYDYMEENIDCVFNGSSYKNLSSIVTTAEFKEKFIVRFSEKENEKSFYGVSPEGDNFITYAGLAVFFARKYGIVSAAFWAGTIWIIGKMLGLFTWVCGTFPQLPLC